MSQRKRGESFQHSQSYQEGVDLREIVNDVVRFIVIKSGDNMPITRSEIMQYVPKPVRFNQILNPINEILTNTYGYELMSVESSKNGIARYIVTNKLPPIELDDDDDDKQVNGNKQIDPEDCEKVLLLMILSRIFMSNNYVTDVSLYNFLDKVGIDTESTNPVFGNVKDYINKNLVKKLYIQINIDDNTNKKTFSWGPRSEVEISKMKILKFVSNVYKNKPADWVTQYEEANEQFSD